MTAMRSFEKGNCSGSMKFPIFDRNKPVETMSLWDYYKSVDNRMAITGERKGQAAFNLLSSFNSKLARKVQNAKVDPFFATDRNAPIWKKFVAFIEENWQ